jgi:hypothetical protein
MPWAPRARGGRAGRWNLAKAGGGGGGSGLRGASCRRQGRCAESAFQFKRARGHAPDGEDGGVVWAVAAAVPPAGSSDGLCDRSDARRFEGGAAPSSLSSVGALVEAAAPAPSSSQERADSSLEPTPRRASRTRLRPNPICSSSRSASLCSSTASDAAACCLEEDLAPPAAEQAVQRARGELSEWPQVEQAAGEPAPRRGDDDRGIARCFRGGGLDGTGCEEAASAKSKEPQRPRMRGASGSIATAARRVLTNG